MSEKITIVLIMTVLYPLTLNQTLILNKKLK